MDPADELSSDSDSTAGGARTGAAVAAGAAGVAAAGVGAGVGAAAAGGGSGGGGGGSGGGSAGGSGGGSGGLPGGPGTVAPGAVDTFSLVVPAGAAAGTLLAFTANGKTIQAAVPPGLAPGQKFTVQVPKPAVTPSAPPAPPAPPPVVAKAEPAADRPPPFSDMPPGWEEKQGPDGRTYYQNNNERRTTWTKPPAAAPIPTVTAAAAPPPATFPVICPHGAGPGSHLRVRAPNTGQEMTVIVPAGVGADSASGNKPYAIAATLRTQVPAANS